MRAARSPCLRSHKERTGAWQKTMSQAPAASERRSHGSSAELEDLVLEALGLGPILAGEDQRRPFRQVPLENAELADLEDF